MKTILRWVFDRPLSKGTEISGQYRIKDVLGMGSYGITYLAERLDGSGPCVVKQLRRTKSWTSDGRKSFDREAEILRTLGSPAAPRLYDVLDSGRKCFIVMEYIDGKTFEDLIFDEGRIFDERETVLVLLEVLRIVSSIHARGMIHRDLRIPNILESKEGIRIIDYGLACSLTEAGETVYRHPEKKLMRSVSVKSDFYALGHFALFLLYSGYIPKTKEEKSWEEELCISAGMKAVLRKMLQIDPPYNSAVDIIADLESNLSPGLVIKENL
ncbi:MULTISPECIES: serine/threonine protein kinase [Bacillus]|uniref:Serine/threonine protein kinase n=1 Tax=Bacillus glycinifermentans TaxID=1664069 RepID=A0AAJ4D0Z9_9BACI|nr:MULTISPECIES: serine/threonine-protein kinase [Bacillus]KKB72071.1 protein kinase [Bacillus sp. TH008]MDU0072396.1 serine/threonine-protein kinase [Bacillus sp. IG6]MED8020189.1 serine/threonine-protein kinase [Bacillus glycinifermentans]QAT63868.1 serine/threonine protein kinase [Bacillus glycinifermentans]WKB77744.1 serine/threonine-protein kinase [Bacillus glycinifermentans]